MSLGSNDKIKAVDGNDRVITGDGRIKIAGDKGDGFIRSEGGDSDVKSGLGWHAPMGWSGLGVRASWAFGPSERWFRARAACIPGRCVA